MKKSTVVLAAFGAFASVANAQSSVTLYGIVDEGFNINTNAGGSRLYNLTSGVIQGSRWGLRGTEDLGGGTKALFVLENGFDLSTGKFGQGGLEFGRQAYVGLGSRYGTVTLGRQYDSVVDYVGSFGVASQWAGYIAAHAGDIDNFNNGQRVNNAVKFSSPNLAGLTFGGLYSLGGVAGDYTRNQIWSIGARYNNGPLVVGAAYLNVRNPNVSFFGNANSGTINPATSNITSPIYSGLGSAHTYQVIAAGGAYTIGAATIGATYSNIKFSNLGSSFASSFAGQTMTFNNAEINFKYQLTPSLLVGAAYDYTREHSVNGAAPATFNQGEAGIDYFLSKRTDVYVIGVYQHASGETVNASGTRLTTAVASLNNLTPSSNSNQFTARVGIRHKF
ncbi:porin [Burkholderia cepacia]|uniref:porin n=1 Tax=Burkholderia cepacia TaxID=292 RepID=UPI001CF44343|nr:porin [Burkholderia cepacia]MCA8031007.1 porin [Burkholderia cepacia]